MRKWALTLALGAIAIVIGTFVYHRPYWRAARIDPADSNSEAISYAPEFAALLTIRDVKHGDIQFAGGDATSPDGRFTLRQNRLRNDYHEITVSSGSKVSPDTVLILQEGDPGSGPAHDWHWSRDSKAVFIYGAGEPAGHPWSENMAIVYLVGPQRLYSFDVNQLIEKSPHRTKNASVEK